MKKIDSHIDIADMYKLWNYTPEDFLSDSEKPPVTLRKLKKSEIDIVGFTLYYDSSFLKTTYYDGVKEFYSFYQDIIQKTDELYPITKAEDVLNKPSDKLGYFFSIEGFECIRTITDFEEFFQKGVRSYGLTWDFTNEYAHARHSESDTGLTKKGKELMKEMSKYNLIIDFAHLGEESAKDVGKYFSGMIVTTHSNARSVYYTKHNLTDSEISLIAERNGVVSLLPLSSDVGEKGTFDELRRHIDYIAEKWGEKYVALSSDIYPLPEYPFIEGYTDVSILAGIENDLLQHYSKESVEKILYKNWERVLTSTL